jgi:UDP-N-acetylglucosamine 2-epimerase (non-hydrolysing)
MKKASVIFGTRPEAIKLCPLVLALRRHPQLTPHVCVTGQHRQMLDQVLEVFGVVPDVDLRLMQPDQTLATLTGRAVAAVDGYLAEYKPDVVLVQGDTTTAFCAALASFYRKVPVGHVEAGLRTWNKHSPFPEEVNRVLTTRVADYHFAPTAWARDNLLREGVAAESVFVTGNTVIDALQFAAAKVRQHPPEIPGVPPVLLAGDARLVLITGHRRENFGPGFESICRAVATLALKFPRAAFVYPVHLNPNVREPVFRLLGGLNNVVLTEPLSYLPFVALMERATVILTDSGGVQEEAPGLGKPVLVMRDTTERPEAVDAGTVRLVGTDADRIVEGVATLLTDSRAYQAMSRAHNPYGDGRACERIVRVLADQRAGSPAGTPAAAEVT